MGRNLAKEIIRLGDDDDMIEDIIDDAEENSMKKDLQVLHLKKLDRKCKSNILQNVNMKKLKGYKDIKKESKMAQMEDDFVNAFKEELDIFDVNERKYDKAIVEFCIQAAEDIFIGKKMGDIKLKNVVKVCLPFFDNNANLVKVFIEDNLHNIIESNVFRRNRMRIANFFSILLKWLYE